MKKSELKAIIKECLIEILAEGLGSKLTTEVKQHTSPTTQMPTGQRRVVPSALDLPVAVNNKVIQAVKEVAGKDSIMESIFSDTAKTTLINQSAQGHDKHSSNGIVTMQDQPSSAMGDKAAQIVAATDLSDLFGEEAMSKWEQAAFAPRKQLMLPNS